MAAMAATAEGLPSWSSSSYISNACLPRDASADGPVAALLSHLHTPEQCRVDGGSLVHQYFWLAIALVLFNLVMVLYFLPRVGDLDPINFDGDIINHDNNNNQSSDADIVLGDNDFEIEYVDGPPPAGAVMMAPERDNNDYEK